MDFPDSRDPRSLSCSGPLFALLLGLLTACSDSSDRPSFSGGDDLPQPDNPLVEGPITGGGAEGCCIVTLFGFPVDTRNLGYTPGTAFYGRPLAYDESAVGYRETEYFISGTAQSYLPTDVLTTDGEWSVEPAEAAEYKVRIVVDRPVNDADFNGTVVLEWFNVTGGLDASPDWNLMHTHITRAGYVWVGVSAQYIGIEGADGTQIAIPLKQVDPERYGSLFHPGDSFSFDIYSQAAQAVRNPVGLDPLEGLKVERMIGVGQSQSASRMATYINAVHPTVDVFDGFIVHSRGAGGSMLSQEPQVEVDMPALVYIRADIPEPVLALQADYDVLNAVEGGDRQPDSAGYRLWEVAGGSHSDLYLSTPKGSLDQGDDPEIADVIATTTLVPEVGLVCSPEANDGPTHWVAKAALEALNNWIITGEAPPSATLLELNADRTGFEVDELGIARGGIRTPYVDAPVAVLSGIGQNPNNGLCRLFGTTALFDEELLARLYPDKQTYVEAIDNATDTAVNAGYILPPDGELIKARARTSPLPTAHPVWNGQ